MLTILEFKKLRSLQGSKAIQLHPPHRCRDLRRAGSAFSLQLGKNAGLLERKGGRSVGGLRVLETKGAFPICYGEIRMFKIQSSDQRSPDEEEELKGLFSFLSLGHEPIHPKQHMHTHPVRATAGTSHVCLPGASGPWGIHPVLPSQLPPLW